jgi:hypothetical protein
MIATSFDVSLRDDFSTRSATQTRWTTARVNFFLLSVWFFVTSPFHFRPTRMYHRYIRHHRHWIKRVFGGGQHLLTGFNTASTLFRVGAVSSFEIVPWKSVCCQQTTPLTAKSISARLFSSPPKSSSFAVPTMGTDDHNRDGSAGTSTEEKSLYSGYEKWVRRLYATNMFHPVKLGLDNMKQLHQLLGNPMDDVSTGCVNFSSCCWSSL